LTEAAVRESQLREQIARTARSIYERGLTHGSTGNISARLADGWLMTPTGASLGDLDPARLSKIAHDGRLLSGDAPTKEAFLHRAVYEQRAACGAVVHLHATHSVAVSLLDDVDAEDVLPPLTAYYVMRIGRLPLVPYFAPGDVQLAQAVRERADRHGPVVAGSSLAAAVDAIEELEATAKLFLLLRHEKVRCLTPAQVADLQVRYPA
jgi:ribulose-5-phosphate 4-epimerase/fuculose-1-phosphate aldolase